MATYGGIRGLAQAFLRAAAERELSASEAIDALRDAGVGTYRRKDMLADYRQFLGIPKKAGAIKSVRLDYRPSSDLYTATKGYQRSVFRYQVNLHLKNPLTGKEMDWSTNVSSELPLTRRQAEESGLDAVLQTVDRYKDDIVDYGLYGVFIQEE